LQKEQKDSKNLKELRDLAVLSFFMLNALVVLVIFLLQLSRDQLHIRWPLGVRETITVDTNTGEVCILYVYTKLYIGIYVRETEREYINMCIT
jgi:chitin synthase